jgi:hypothetical protein
VSGCRVCPADVVWAVTVNDKPQPIDAQPAPGGNVRLTRDGQNRWRAEVLGPLDVLMADDADQLHWPHHATCPNWGK